MIQTNVYPIKISLFASMTKLRTGQRKNRGSIPERGKRYFTFSKSSRQVRGSTYSLQSDAEVNNWWSQASAPHTHIHTHTHTHTHTHLHNTGVLISPQPDLLPDLFCLMVRIFRLMVVLLYIYIYIYMYSTNIPRIIMIINRIDETQNLLSLQLVSFLVGLRTYQHLCVYSDTFHLPSLGEYCASAFTNTPDASLQTPS